MIDVPVIPPNPPSSVQPSLGESLPNALLKIPQGLESLVKGAILNATVIRPDYATNPLLQFTSPPLKTSELPISTKLALPDGANVQLKILTNTLPGSAEAQALQRAGEQPVPQFRAQVLTVDDKPPLLPAGITAGSGYDTVRAVVAQITPPAPNSAAPTLPVSSATQVHLTTGASFQATFLTPSTNAGALLTTPTPPQPQDVLSVRILDTSFRGVSGAQPEPQTPSPPAPASQLAAYTRLAQPEGLSVQTLAQSFADRPHGTNPALPTLSAPPAAQNLLSFSATVIGTEKSGEVMVQSPLGTLRLPQGIALPQGTSLTLEAISLSPATPAPLPDTIATPRSTPLLLQESMAELTALLKNPDINYLLPPAQQLIPHAADKQFAARLFWFLTGAAQGNTTLWLGKEARTLLEDTGHKSLLQKLDAAFGGLRAAFAEPTPQGWVTLAFPVYDGEELRQGYFHLHRDPEQEKDNKRKPGSRFMVELELEETGEMQIDGLVHNNAATLKVDLIIRTYKPMPDDMRVDILGIFEESNATTGLDGSLQFQTMREFPVHPRSNDDNPQIILA